MKRVFIGMGLIVLLGVAACGKSTPSTPGPTVSGLALSPATDWIKIKGTEKFFATATYTTGAAEAVTASWSSDNQAVATVDNTGTVTGVSAGQATITASYQGKTVTRSLRVLPDYAGRWAGTWAVTSCEVQGGFPADWCTPMRGAVLPATLEMQQSRDAVSGAWTLQESNGNVQGTVATNGTLTLTGSTLQSGVRIEIVAWQSNTTDNSSMTGTFTLSWQVTGRAGSGQTVVEMRNFTKQ